MKPNGRNLDDRVGGLLSKGEAIGNLLEGLRGQAFEFGLEAVGNGEPL